MRLLFIQKEKAPKAFNINGAEGEIRTLTLLQAHDPESSTGVILSLYKNIE